ncbi:MAG: N-acetyltransferase [Actinomycetota bacterium]|nr:N-acetyltransferase [Actinomycetota bacterium]
MADDTPPVTDNQAANRFELEVDGHLALLEYRLQGDRLLLIHTEVPEALGGRGLGGVLVEAAIERIRAEQLTVVPHCPFVRRWLEKRPEVADTLTIDWPDA